MAEIFASGWTLAAFKAREEDRRLAEQIEMKRAALRPVLWQESEICVDDQTRGDTRSPPPAPESPDPAPDTNSSQGLGKATDAVVNSLKDLGR